LEVVYLKIPADLQILDQWFQVTCGGRSRSVPVSLFVDQVAAVRVQVDPASALMHIFMAFLSEFRAQDLVFLHYFGLVCHSCALLYRYCALLCHYCALTHTTVPLLRVTSSHDQLHIVTYRTPEVLRGRKNDFYFILALVLNGTNTVYILLCKCDR
jgi:hypothetical protein